MKKMVNSVYSMKAKTHILLVFVKVKLLKTITFTFSEMLFSIKDREDWES